MEKALHIFSVLLAAVFIILSALIIVIVVKTEIRRHMLDDGVISSVAPPPRYERTFDCVLDQCAEKEMKEKYSSFLPDRLVADARIFGLKQTKKTPFAERYSVFVLLDLQEYVVFQVKAYPMSHRQGEAIIDYEVKRGGAALKGIEWCPEGKDPETWLRERFPESNPGDINRYERLVRQGKEEPLARQTDRVAREMLGVPVERGRALTIDRYKGAYELSETEGAETKIVEKGVLKMGSPRARARKSIQDIQPGAGQRLYNGGS